MEILDLDTLRSVDELAEYDRAIARELSQMHERANGLPFDEPEREAFSTLSVQHTEIGARITELEGRHRRLAELASNPRAIEREPRAVEPSPVRTLDPQSMSAGLRALERHGAYLSRDAGDRLERLVRTEDPLGIGARYLAVVGDPNYCTAFGKLAADPMTGHLRFSPQEVAAVRAASAVMAERAMSEGTTTAGGFAIPFTLDPSILLSSTGVLNPVRALSRVITVATREWRGVSSDGVTAAYAAEGTEAADGSPTLAQPVIKAEMGRAFVPFSIELGQDWSSLEQELLGLIRDARDVLDATKMLTGSGTNEPSGVLTGLSTTQRVLTNTIATYAVGDPWLLKAALPARFIPSTTFAANPATWDTTYRFVGGNSTEPLQLPTRDGNFLGRPKVEWSTVATGLVTGTKTIIGGDFRAGYTIVDRIGMTAEVIPHLFAAANLRPSGQRGLYVYWRTGAVVVVPNAFRYLEIK